MTLLLDAALKGSVLILAAALVAYFLRGKSAAARHAAWTAAVIGHLAIPAFALLLPHWKLPLLSPPSWIETQVSDVAPITKSIDEPTPVAAPAAPAPVQGKVESPAQTPPSSTTIATRKWSSLPVVAVLWITGAVIVLLRLAVGTWKVGRLAKNGDRVDDGEWLSLTQRLANRLGITRPLTLLRGDRLAVPVTWGVVYPAVLLPPDSIEWPEERRRFVLVHEMAHVKRFDALTQLIAQLTIAIFWFDPLIWLAAHRMRVEREHACDDYVIRDGTKPSLYAGELLEMVQSIGLPRHERAAPAFAALAMARRSEFEGRMLSILDARQDRRTLGRKTAAAATVALAI
ncbi:MAG TPA: M56 family metallopeptidase, partial [Gemmatimonadaceae bacterium]|nr:M56 family metallopeptidase [Gemmatimonadaceae bacterium]